MKILFGFCIFILLVALFIDSADAQPIQKKWGVNTGGSGSDYGYALSTDASGNIYVAGYFKGTADFNPGKDTFNLVSAGNDDIFLAKYDSSSRLLWAKSMGGPQSDYAYAMHLDDSGFIYLTGSFLLSADFDPDSGKAILLAAGSEDIFLACYDSSGHLRWVKSMGGKGSDIARSIDVDDSGSITITGYFKDIADFDPSIGQHFLTSIGKHDVFVAMYDPLGNLIQAIGMGGPRDDFGMSVVKNPSGKIYITGYFSDFADFDPGNDTVILTSKGNADIFIASYDQSGKLLWANNIGGAFFDYASSIATDDSGHIYITGCFKDIADFDPGIGIASLSASGINDIFLAAYDTSGEYIWAKQIGLAGDNSGINLITDSIGNIYFTGYFADSVNFDPGLPTYFIKSKGGLDMFIAKFDHDGNFIWVETAGGSTEDNGLAVCLASSNYIYCAGFISDTVDFDGHHLYSAGNEDVFMVKYLECKDPVITTEPSAISVCHGADAVFNISITGSIDQFWQMTADSGLTWLSVPDTGLFSGSNTAVLFLKATPFSLNNSWFRCLLINNCHDTFPSLPAVLTVFSSTVYHLKQLANICPGDTFIFPDSSVATKDSTHTSYLKSIAGCDSIIITDLKLRPTYLIYANDTICNGAIYVFPDGTTATKDTVHTSSFTSIYGCDSLIMTRLKVNPVFAAYRSDTICNGDIFTFPDGSTSTISLSHTSHLFTISGCDSLITDSLLVIIPDTSVLVKKDTLSAKSAGSSYIWIDCLNGFQPVSGQLNRDFVPSTDGSYALVITWQGCTDTSGCYVIKHTGEREQLEVNDFILYPNPAGDFLTIRMTNRNNDLEIMVYDDQGKNTMTEVHPPNTDDYLLDLSPLVAGIYLLKIRNKNTGKYVGLKFIKSD